MNIIWQYLDKRSAAVNALKDYNSMAYILAHTDEEIAQVHEDTTTLGSPTFTDMPGSSPNPQSGEMRIITFFFGEKLKEMQARENREEQIVQRVQHSLLRHTVEKGLAYIPQRDFYMKVKGKDLNSMEHFHAILETLEERNVLQVQRSGNKYLIYVSPFLF